MAYIGDDKVLLFSGYDTRGQYPDDTWVYDLSENSWTQKTNPATRPSPRGTELAYIGDDKVLLFGGWGPQGGFYDDTWVYDLSEKTWTEMVTPGPSAREYYGLAYIGDGKVLLFGGLDFQGRNCNDTWVYDVNANTWTNQNPSVDKPSVRRNHDMCYLGDGQALLFGGWGSAVMDDTWSYDLNANTWTLVTTTTSPLARRSHRLSETSLDGSSNPVLFGGTDFGSADLDDTWTFGSVDTTPLEISVSVDLNELWPPNHKMKTIVVTVEATDDSDLSPTVVLTSIVSNEPDDAPGGGDGHTTYDIQEADIGTDDREFLLRAERSGKGNGRIYTITYTATDASGNIQSASATVTVPHDKGKGKAAPGLLAFKALSAYPQPCNPEAWIPYTLAKDVEVAIAIYNSSGRMIRTLQLGHQDAGAYISRGKAAYWDGKNDIGETVSSGVYFYTLKAGDFIATKKLVIAR